VKQNDMLTNAAYDTMWKGTMTKSKIFFVAMFVVLLSCSSSRLRAQSGTTAQWGRHITCASDDGKRHYCRIPTGGGARMTNQRSGSPCIQGRTWGYDMNGIWVDRGCRADFEVRPAGYRPGAGPGGPGYGGRTITCSSNNGGRNYCAADTRGGVRMVNQRSGSPCVQGRTWGFDGRGIWVDRGCRADFALGR
jgi:hypothetical protein